MENHGEKLALYLSKYSDCIVLLHTTREEKIAATILREGFLYESQISYSTDRVSPLEPVEIVYFLYQRKEYGKFTVVIAIPKNLYQHYTELAMDKNLTLEEVMGTGQPSLNENDEHTYRLDRRYIAGYFNMISGEFVHNPAYNP